MRYAAPFAAVWALAGLLPACFSAAAWAQNNVPTTQNPPPSRYQVQPVGPSGYAPAIQSGNGQQQGNYPIPSTAPANVQPRSAYAPNSQYQGQPQANQTQPNQPQTIQTQTYQTQPGQPLQPVRVANNPNAAGQPPQQGPIQYAPNQLPPRQVPQNINLPQNLPAGAAPPNGANGPVQVQQQVPQRARFQLTPQERENLHTWLAKWETQGEQIKNFACKFERWEYDPVFGPGANIPKTKGYGDLKYVKPDKGHFKIEKLEHYTPATVPMKPATYETRQGDVGEHWVCDGKAVFEYKFDVKKLMVYEIPEEMRGKAISNGPLPFLFGAKKEELLERYDMKVINETEKQVWLDAWPLRQQDAANFQHVEVILNRDSMNPEAMQVIMPNGKNRMVYIFQVPSVNNALSSLIDWFEQPRTPLGWEKVIERAPTPQEIEAQRQALQQQRPAGNLPR